MIRKSSKDLNNSKAIIDHMGSPNLIARLGKSIANVSDKVQSITNLLAERRDVEAELESLGKQNYVVADLHPVYILGPPIPHGSIQTVPAVVGSNGCPGRSEVVLRHSYVPAGFKLSELLGEEPHSYEWKEAEHDLAKYFSGHMAMNVSFSGESVIFSRTVEYCPSVLLKEVERFRRDLELAKFYLVQAAKAP